MTDSNSKPKAVAKPKSKAAAKAKENPDPLAGTEPRQFTSDEYNNVVGEAELTTINLLESNFFLSPNFFEAQDKVEILIKEDCLEVSYEEEKPIAFGRFRWTLRQTEEDKEFLHFSATYLVVYHVGANRNVDAVGEFLRRSGFMAAYPYYRALTAQISWSSGANLPVMPLRKSFPSTAPKPKTPD